MTFLNLVFKRNRNISSAFLFLPSILCSFLTHPILGNETRKQMSSCSNSEKSEFIIGYVTIGNEDAAVELAKKLVGEVGLVACVNILPKIRSIYKWDGKIEDEAESMMIVKTRASKREKLIEFVRANHAYETPEVIFTSIVGGNPAYLKWLGETVEG